MKKIILILSIFFMFSCSKNKQESPEDSNNPTIFFISFESGNQQFYFDEEYFLIDFSNQYLAELDQLNLNMKSSTNNRYRCNVFIHGANIFDKSLPLQLDGNSHAIRDGRAELQLIDQINTAATTFGPDDDYNFTGSTLTNQLSLTITSLSTTLIECSFEGIIETKTGKPIHVQNGRLKIQLH